MRNPGKIIKLEDGRLCILLNKQPLFADFGKYVLHLIDDNYIEIKDGKNKVKTLLKKPEDLKNCKVVGMID